MSIGQYGQGIISKDLASRMDILIEERERVRILLAHPEHARKVLYAIYQDRIEASRETQQTWPDIVEEADKLKRRLDKQPLSDGKNLHREPLCEEREKSSTNPRYDKNVAQ